MYSVTDDPGSKPDQKYARLRDRQNYMGRIKNKVKFRASRKIISLVYNILVGDRGGTVVKVLCYKSEVCWFDPS